LNDRILMVIETQW